MTVTGHKVGGPLGVGALLVAPRRRLVPQSLGGGQERQVRSGTLDVAGDPRVRGRHGGVRQDASRPRRPRLIALRDRLIARAHGPRLRHHGDRRVGGRRRHTPAARQRPPARARAARATRCSTCSTPRASSARPVRRARRACRSRRTCCSRWGSRRSRPRVRCGSRSATRPPTPTSTRCSPRCPRRIDRAAAGQRVGRLMRVVAAMSGGVDSAVAAAPDARRRARGRRRAPRAVARAPRRCASRRRGCCTIEDAGDARRVADVLGIPFYVWDFAERFKRGRDRGLRRRVLRRPHPEPVPALQRADQVRRPARQGGRAGLRRRGDRSLRAGRRARRRRRELHRAVDMAKDQSYVLGVLDADQLARAFFPLGDTTKPEIRAEAGSAASRSRASPTRHDICFIPDGDTAGWLTSPAGGAARARSSTPSPARWWVAHQGAYALHRRPATRARARPVGHGRRPALRRLGRRRRQPRHDRHRQTCWGSTRFAATTPGGAVRRPRASSRSAPRCGPTARRCPRRRRRPRRRRVRVVLASGSAGSRPASPWSSTRDAGGRFGHHQRHRPA